MRINNIQLVFSSILGQKMQLLHLLLLACEMLSDYCVHVNIVAGSSDVRLRTEPRTLASVYEETLISACQPLLSCVK